MNFNRVILVGNLTKDPEVRNTNSGQQVAHIRLAVTRHWKTKDGEKREETLYIDVEAWRQLAEVLSSYTTKGSEVLVEGYLKLDEWTTKDGDKRTAISVVADTIQLGARGGSHGNNGGQSSGGYESSSSNSSSGYGSSSSNESYGY